MKSRYLKTIFYNSIINNLFIITFLLILFLISLNHHIVLIGYIIYLYYIYKKDKTLFYLSIIICIIVLIVFIIIKLSQNFIINNYDNTIIGKVINLEIKENYQKITIRYKIFKVIIKDYEFLNLKLGNIIKVYGYQNNIDTNHIPYAFNYKNYFYNNLYVLEIKAEKIEILRNSISLFKLNELVNNYLTKFFKDDSLMVLKGFITGDTSDFSDDFNNSLTINGIIHLFAISGSHIVLIISFLEILFKKNKNKNKIINLTLFIYLLITKFSVSILRAVLTYYLNCLFKKRNIKLTSLDISCIVFILLIIINPFYMYNLGFILSFASTFLIILLNPYIKNLNNVLSILVITLVINIFSFPLIINMNNEINILSPIINIIMILLVEGVLIPLSFIVLVFPILNIGYTYIISGFINLNDFLATICTKSGFVIQVGNLSNFIIILFYLLILLIVIYNNKKPIKKSLLLIFMFLIVLILFNINHVKLSPEITFLDLYNGDCTIIEYKDEVIIIDTGEGINNEVSSFLKSKGIKKIDYLILTHDHSDHNGEAQFIIENYKVKNILVSIFDNSKYSNYNESLKLKQGDIINTKYIKINILFPYCHSENENNNSLVLYFSIENINFLFTGDIEEDIEKEFDNLNVDVLKVSHHGSESSTSINFLKKVKPKYSIIMSGRNNKYEFPSNDVIKRLQSINSIVYCTKDCYTITLKIKNQKCIFKPLKLIKSK